MSTLRWAFSNALLENKLKMLKKEILPDLSILHICCGTGCLLKMLCPKNAARIELSFDLVNFARTHYPENNIL